MMQCVFVNTDQKPLKIIRLGYFHIYRRNLEREAEVQEMCQVFYSHPDAPDSAVVSVYRYLPVNLIAALLPSVEFAEKAMKGFIAASSLANSKDVLIAIYSLSI